MRFLNSVCVVASLLAAICVSQCIVNCDSIITTIVPEAVENPAPSTLVIVGGSEPEDTGVASTRNVPVTAQHGGTYIASISTHSPKYKVLTKHTANPSIQKMKYILDGPFFHRCSEVDREVKRGVPKPFSEVMMTTVGDPQAHGQAPITFIRQVLSLVSFPSSINDTHFPPDVKKRAQEIILGFPGGSLGSYGSFFGNDLIRQDVANFITRRDEGVPSRAEDVFLTNGATAGILAMLELFSEQAAGRTVGVMVSRPGFPAYQSFLTEFGMHRIDYYLNRTHNWAIDIPELERALTESKSKCHPRAIFVTNPGNPSGRIVTRQEIENIIKFAYKEKLFILADEVYQENIYDPKAEFHSFKKIMMQMGAPYNSVELASFFSVSKGYAGESGLRGGYVEVINMDRDAKDLLIKTFGAKSPPNSYGQVALDCVINPPRPGSPSFPLFHKEKSTIINTLTLKANIITKALNSIPGISTFPMQASFFIFPKITMPQAAIDAAAEKHMSPDLFYAFELLENTGICVVAGEEFGQYPGTYYFRTSILPEPHKLVVMMEKLRGFNWQFLEKFKKVGGNQGWAHSQSIQDKSDYEGINTKIKSLA